MDERAARATISEMMAIFVSGIGDQRHGESYAQRMMASEPRWPIDRDNYEELDASIRRLGTRVVQNVEALRRTARVDPDECEVVERQLERGLENLQRFKTAFLVMSERYPDAEPVLRTLVFDEDAHIVDDLPGVHPVTRFQEGYFAQVEPRPNTWLAGVWQMERWQKQLNAALSELYELCHRSSEYRRRFVERWQKAYNYRSAQHDPESPESPSDSSFESSARRRKRAEEEEQPALMEGEVVVPFQRKRPRQYNF